MTFDNPIVLMLAVPVTAAAVTAYVMAQRRRAAVRRTTGLGLAAAGGRTALRRHLPYALFLAALPVLLTGLARPQATIDVPKVSGTVMLVFDVSTSMTADDVKPSRLAAAQQAPPGSSRPSRTPSTSGWSSSGRAGC
jgi:Ca-activated chloride channel family protein